MQRATVRDQRLLQATRSAILTATLRPADNRGTPRIAAQNPAPKRSKVKATLIGAAIGGGLGAVGGLSYAKATGDGAYPQAIPALAGIGAGMGSLAGLIVALF